MSIAASSTTTVIPDQQYNYGVIDQQRLNDFRVTARMHKTAFVTLSIEKPDDPEIVYHIFAGAEETSSSGNIPIITHAVLKGQIENLTSVTLIDNVCKRMLTESEKVAEDFTQEKDFTSVEYAPTRESFLEKFGVIFEDVKKALEELDKSTGTSGKSKESSSQKKKCIIS